MVKESKKFALATGGSTNEIAYHFQESSDKDPARAIPAHLSLGILARTIASAENYRQVVEILLQKTLVSPLESISLAASKAIVLALQEHLDAFPWIVGMILDAYELSGNLFLLLKELVTLFRLPGQQALAVSCLDKFAEVPAKTTLPIETRMACIQSLSLLVDVCGVDHGTKLMLVLSSLTARDTDESLQQIASLELSRLLADAGSDHPMIERLVSSMLADINATDPTRRTRSAQRLGVFARFMDVTDVATAALRLLGDPNRATQEAIITTILAGSISNLQSVSEAWLQKVSSLAEDDLFSPRSPSFSIPHLAAPSPLHQLDGLNVAVQVPFEDEDQCNWRYLQGDQYSRLCAYYSLDPSQLQRHDGTLDFKDASTQHRSGSITEAAEIRRKQTANVLRLPDWALISAFIEQDAGVAHLLLDKLLLEIPAEHSSSVVMEEVFLKASIIANISNGCAHVTSSLDRCRLGLVTVWRFCEMCRIRSDSLRSDIFKHLRELRIVIGTKAGSSHLGYSHADFVKGQNFRENVANAAEPEVARVAEEKSLRRRVDELNEELRASTEALMTIGGVICGIYASPNLLDDEDWTVAFDNMIALLSNEHRGVRAKFAGGISALAAAKLDSSAVGLLIRVRMFGGQYIPILMENSRVVRRQKVDIMLALSSCLLPLRDISLEEQFVHALVRCWDDTDGTVRRTSMQLFQTLSEKLVQSTRLYLEATSGKAAPLVTLITDRVNDPYYPEKNALNEMLRWYFGRSKAFSRDDAPESMIT